MTELCTTVESEVADGQLVGAARAGDMNALAILLARHRPLLLTMCRRVMRSSDVAEDAAQEACVHAMLSLGQLRVPERFGPWLAGIGMNVCRNWLRQQSTVPLSALELSGGWSGAGLASLEPDPCDLAESADIAERVRNVVRQLPPGQRSAVAGFYLSGLTYAEIVAGLGIAVSAVRTRLHKGRASLRKDLRSLWEEQAVTKTPDVVEMRIADVRRGRHDATPAAHLVLLEEIDGDRRLPIWIGPHEGTAMAQLLERIDLRRPMAHQFMFNALGAVGARVIEVRIDRLAEKTFYAVAVIEGPSGVAEVDARPSDALNAALLAGARVTVRAELLDPADDAIPQMLTGLDEQFPDTARDLVAELLRHAGGTPPTT